MIQIDNPINKQAALVVDSIGKIVFHFGRFCGLWNITKYNMTTTIPRKILIIEEEPIGDVIMATPIFSSLRNKYPNSYIVVMVGSWAKNILLNNPYIDEIIIQDCPWAFSDLLIGKKGILNHIKYLFNNFKFVNQLKDMQFDLAIDLRGDFRNILLFMFLPRIKYTISFDRSGGAYLLSAAVYFKKEEHEVDKNYRLLECLNIEEDERIIAIFPSDKDKKRIKNFLEQHSINENDFISIIHPGTRKKVKLWPPKKYAYIGDFMSKEYNAKLILTGSKEEIILNNKICYYMNEEPINASGKFNLLEVAALLSRANLLICPDTSIMHLAAAFNTPTVALFGPSDPNQTGPYQKNICIIDKNFPCRPCLQKKCTINEQGFSACMDAIDINEVKTAIKKLLNNQAISHGECATHD